MQKKLTVLFAFAIFVLFVGWAITPTKAHANHCDKKPDHKHCTQDGNGGGKGTKVPANSAFRDMRNSIGELTDEIASDCPEVHGEFDLTGCHVGNPLRLSKTQFHFSPVKSNE